MRTALCACVLLWLSTLAGCTAVAPARRADQGTISGKLVTVYLARRSWHVDVGLAATDLDPSLGALPGQFRTAKYLFFGFGDRRYLLRRNQSGPVLLRALWPGPALILVTAIDNTPALAFGGSQVLMIQLTASQAHMLQAFIRRSIPDSDLAPVAPGPYPGSEYYAASQQYSALHTCNTWAARRCAPAVSPSTAEQSFSQASCGRRPRVLCSQE
jgi:hypothetical protein